MQRQLWLVGLAALVGCMRNGFETTTTETWQLLVVDATTRAPIAEEMLANGDMLTVAVELREETSKTTESVNATWTLLGNSLLASDLQWQLPSASTAVFAPSRPGTAVIMATLATPDSRVANPTATTGVLTVVATTTVARLLIVSGDNQLGTVGEPLPQPFVVEAHDSEDAPLPGALIAFSVVSGGGNLSSSESLVSAADGRVSMAYAAGTTASALSDVIRAVAVTNPSAAVEFHASALPGDAAQLMFNVMPQSGYVGSSFAVQPVVVAADRFGNRTNSNATVALSVAVGTGVLTGTTAVAMNAGQATFVDVGYDRAEAGVVVRATSGDLQVDADALTLAEPPPGACQRDDSYFVTSEGGCKDLQTGLIWSHRSGTNYLWQEAIWDSVRTENPADANDLGRTNDYPEVGPSSDIAVTDWSTVAYCHNLVEANMSDWRMPNQSELVLLVAHLQAGTPPYLAGTANELVLSSNYHHGPSSDLVGSANFVTGTTNADTFPDRYATYCVRGKRSAPSQLAVLGGPTTVGANSRLPRPFLIQVQQADGKRVNREAEVITVSDPTSGSLAGTVATNTDVIGVATFGDFRLDAVGDVTLTFSATGIQPTTYNLRVGAFPHTCALEDNRFQTAEGGCKDTQTHRVWSLASPTAMTWYEAIWDAANPSGNVPADADDGSLTNDYDNNTGAWVDSSYTNYCHDLVEGGFADWRMPSANELNDVYALGLGSPSHLVVDVNQEFHSSTSVSSNPVLERRVNLKTGVTTDRDKSYTAVTLCVRVGS